MAELVHDCPRCGSQKITFDAVAQNLRWLEHDWLHVYEVFCICRECHKSTIFVLAQKEYDEREFFREKGPIAIKGGLNNHATVRSYISLKDESEVEPPEHLPEAIAAIFNEGAKCAAIECYNAAGTMFRLCVDLGTQPLLPKDEVAGLNAKTRRDLGLRLPWLFDNKRLPETLRELASCIKEDGNDGAHKGTLKKEDVDDLLDFTMVLLERIYTELTRLRIAKERREERRKPPPKPA